MFLGWSRNSVGCLVTNTNRVCTSFLKEYDRYNTRTRATTIHKKRQAMTTTSTSTTSLLSVSMSSKMFEKKKKNNNNITRMRKRRSVVKCSAGTSASSSSQLFDGTSLFTIYSGAFSGFFRFSFSVQFFLCARLRCLYRIPFFKEKNGMDIVVLFLFIITRHTSYLSLT